MSSISEIDFRSAGEEYLCVTPELVRSLLKERPEDSHKGTYGHAIMIAGCTGMMGAAVLSVGGALRSGCGLVTAHVPFQERSIIHITHPSAIVECDPEPVFSTVPGRLESYKAAGIGCGIGKDGKTAKALESTLSQIRGMQKGGHGGAPVTVLDADALNIISEHPGLFGLIPEDSVLTPHLGELDRLLRSAISAGVIEADSAESGCKKNGCHPFIWEDSREATILSRRLSCAISSTIVVKGPHTMICPPSGKLYFNMTGNPGMAKGGSGDILAGLLTGLCARGYTPLEASIAAVWYHGKAGDDAAEHLGTESMCATDILDHLKVG